MVAAVAVGCGSARAPHSGLAPSPCQSPGPAGRALTITLAGNGQAYCLRVGDKLHVYLRGTGSGRWLPPLASGSMVVPAPDPALTLARGVTGASFAAVRPGQVVITSVRPPCRIAIPPAKSELEPASPLRKTYPLRFCAPARRFSVSITVLR
jgi:hypothetical protein